MKHLRGLFGAIVHVKPDAQLRIARVQQNKPLVLPPNWVGLRIVIPSIYVPGLRGFLVMRHKQRR